MPPNNEISTKPACAAGLVHENDIIDLKIVDADQWKAIEKLRDRPPIWTTVLLTVMGGIVGSALTFAAMAAKFAAMASKIAAVG